ncbi:metallophosphoesterase [Alteribacillus bidgolensis]|uniref:Predicted phosphohydrolase, MPP superfamily n=1 Tax=Alteribacillus bidgolensis TaxID=930129 RepID=A0A1G8C1Z2_9BACI|nr:metallophosphoesterase family protein [Alteribacillus bidgolensis]SDH39492.1 Predicted phosphohydrolase, MPP superfamily [Alteribacillus bidgolensis]
MKWFKMLFYLLSLWALLMFIEGKRTRIRNENLYLTHLPKSFWDRSIFFISDIHFRCIPNRLIKKVKNKAELVIIGGDIMEEDVPLERVQKNIRKLSEIGQVLFVWGNNDAETKERLQVLLEKEKVITLENSIYSWQINNEVLKIAGLVDKEQRLNEAVLADKKEKGIPILAVHDPAVLNQLSNPSVFEAVLSGHTHGGQIRLGHIGPREKGGWKTRRGVQLLISNGFGTTSLPLRWGAPAESHLITLKAKA